MSKINIETKYDLDNFKVEGDLLSLIEGVAYIQNFYQDCENLTQDKILETIIKVLDIERLRAFNSVGYYNKFSIDSFVREQVLEIILREKERGLNV
jgi:hypothetical protein